MGKTMSSEHSRKITIFSFLYSICIVFYHFNLKGKFGLSFEAHNFLEWGAIGLDDYMTSFGGYAVSFFFTLSAFLLYYNFSRGNWLEKVKRRVYTLVVPVLLWNMMYFLWFDRSDIGTKSLKMFFLDLFASNYNPQLWYMVGLIFWVIICFPVYEIMKRPLLGELVLILSIVISYSGWTFVPDNEFVRIFTLVRFLSYIPNYLFGAYIALRWEKIVLDIEPNIYARIIALIAFIFPFFKLDLGPVSYLLIQFHYVFLWMLIPTTWFTKELPKFFKYSFMIYAIHGGLYWQFAFFFDDHNLFYYAIEDVSTISVYYILGSRVLMGSVNLCCCLLISYLLSRFTPKIYKVLSGGRV